MLGTWSEQNPVDHWEGNTLRYSICVFLNSFYKALFIEWEVNNFELKSFPLKFQHTLSEAIGRIFLTEVIFRTFTYLS